MFEQVALVAADNPVSRSWLADNVIRVIAGIDMGYEIGRLALGTEEMRGLRVPTGAQSDHAKDILGRLRFDDVVASSAEPSWSVLRAARPARSADLIYCGFGPVSTGQGSLRDAASLRVLTPPTAVP